MCSCKKTRTKNMLQSKQASELNKLAKRKMQCEPLLGGMDALSVLGASPPRPCSAGRVGNYSLFWLCSRFLFRFFAKNNVFLVAGARGGSVVLFCCCFSCLLFFGLPSVFWQPVWCFQSSSGAARQARHGSKSPPKPNLD